MNPAIPEEARKIMDERFGHDTLIALATLEGDRPCVRTVNACYRDGAFYVITYARSGKMRQIQANPTVALCGEWFTAHGTGENLGWVLADENAETRAWLKEAFSQWYGNGHVNEADPNTCILRVRLTDGLLLSHGTRYDLQF